MTYQSTLDFLYTRLPMFSRVGSSAYKKDLTNTISLCEYFDSPHLKFKSIHIGGTNGKGSTTNYLGSTLIEAGLKVGIYTSPHLVDFRERIKIGNQYVSEEFVIDFVEKAKPIIEKIEPSFFELTVVMAFEYFAQQQVDIAMIEVGLGGRLDSTNVISPLLSIITNVSFDHMNMLGNTLELIATEKAGIIKSNTPVVIGELDELTMPIFEAKAKLENADLFCAEKLVNSENWIKNNNWKTPSYKLKNIKSTYCALATLRDKELINIDWNLLDLFFLNGINRVVENTAFLGRWTRMNVLGKNLILECAHNEAGVIELSESLKSETYNHLYIVYGTVNDKDLSNIISLLPKKENITYILSQADIPRALSVSDLAALFAENNIKKYIATSAAKQGLEKAIELASFDDLILVTGSIFLVGEVLGEIKDNF